MIRFSPTKEEIIAIMGERDMLLEENQRLRGLLAEINDIANEGMQATYNLASFNASQISRIKYLLLEKKLSDEMG